MANISKLIPKQCSWINITREKKSAFNFGVICPFNLMVMMELLDFCSMDQFPEFNIWLSAREAG